MRQRGYSPEFRKFYYEEKKKFTGTPHRSAAWDTYRHKKNYEQKCCDRVIMTTNELREYRYWLSLQGGNECPCVAN